jgi:uncharacterized protein YqeY
MAELKARIQDDLGTAMKARDELAVATLRMALAAVQKAEVAGDEQVTLTDDEIVGVLHREARSRRDSAQVYEDAGRTELAARERAEAEVLDRYLPAAVDDAALTAVVEEEVAAARAAGTDGPRAIGVVVKAVRARLGATADGARVAAAVKGALGLA